MHTLKKTAAAFLTLSFMLTGCAQNNTDKNTTANNSDPGNASEITDPADTTDAPSAV